MQNAGSITNIGSINNSDFIPVQLSDIISEVKSLLEISETTEHDPDLYKWAYDSLYKMNALQTMKIANVVLDLEDGEADLPVDMINFIALRFCDEHGVAYGPYISDYAFLTECNCTVNGDKTDYNGYMMINDNKLILRHLDDEMPKKVTMAYRAVITDHDGFRVVYNYMSDAVVNYVGSKFTFKYLHIPKYQIKYPELKKNWKAQHDRVIALGAHQDFIKNRRAMYYLTHPLIISL